MITSAADIMNSHLISAVSSSQGSDLTHLGGVPRRASTIVIILGLLWFSVVVTASVVMVVYSNTAGASKASPFHWPTQSQIPLDVRLPTLILFAHPHCPCTRASLGELEILQANAQGQLKVHVLFFKPLEVTQDWVNTDLWRQAAAIPGVTVHSDNGGVEATRFHSETSGHTVLYHQSGRLMFQGGITISRGHSGDNPGRSSIMSLLQDEVSKPEKTLVFGCSFLEIGSRKGDLECKP